MAVVTVEARIVSTGETPYARRPEASVTTTRLLAAAAREALADAALTRGDVDGVGVASFSLAPDRAVDVAFRLGLALRWLMDGTTGGASALDMREVVRQLRGAANGRQVAGARVGLVSAYGMVVYRHGASANAAVLEAVG
jgi:thiolase-like protein